MAFEPPPVLYTTAPDGVHLAYEQFGEGVADVVFVDAGQAGIDTRWANPLDAPFLTQLAGFARVTTFDRRGTGSSDRTLDIPPVEAQVDDLLAVMDTVGLERAVLFGRQSGAGIAMVAAASHPERVAGVVAYAFIPRVLRGPDWPFGATAEEAEEMLAAAHNFDLDVVMRYVMPTFADDPDARRMYEKAMRASSGPAGLVAGFRATLTTDVRSALPMVAAPVRLLAPDCSNDTLAANRWMAEVLPDAELVEMPWPDVLFLDPQRVAAEVEEFVTGARPQVPVQRTLATVLFTDIVDSTARAAEMGDAEWRALLGRHDRALREVVEGGRGRVVQSTGDGVLATFDGPARAVEAARRFRESCRAAGLEIRAGLHVGEVETRGDDVGGIAVHIAGRVQGLAEPGEILVTRTVKDLTYGAGLEFEDRGTRELKGVPDPWQVLAVTEPGEPR